MAADNKLELVIQVDAAGANASIKNVNKSLSGLEKEAVSSAKGASKGIDGMTLSMTKAVVAGNAIYDVAKRAFAALKDFTLGAIQTQDEMGKDGPETWSDRQGIFRTPAHRGTFRDKRGAICNGGGATLQEHAGGHAVEQLLSQGFPGLGD